MPDSFQIRQQLTLLEYMKVSFYIFMRMKIMRTIFIFGFIISIANGLLDLQLEKKKVTIWATIFSFINLPVFETLFFGILFLIGVTSIYKFKPEIFKNTVYRFTPWGMERINNQTNFTAPWNQFVAFKETKNFFYLFLNKDCHAVQKRLFNSPDEIKMFRVFIKVHILIN